jgi:chloramphenicol-sensitive protein RarD
MQMRVQKGVWYAAAAYSLWGLFPIYYKALQQVPALQIVAHRFVWSFLFVILLIAGRRELPALRAALRPRLLLVYLAAGSLLAANWLTYIWGINAGFVIETSLGYFISPLVSVVLGMVFLGEKLRPAQWPPVGLAAAGVVYLTWSYGSLPWIALVLALTFGLYGLTKKTAPLGALHGLALETGLVFLPALGLLLFVEAGAAGAFGHAGVAITALLMLTGVVTAVPLLLFTAGAQRIPLATVGLLQYIAPTLQFLTGVYLYGEAFPPSRLVGFSLIWAALVIFSTESFLASARGNRRWQSADLHAAHRE